MKVWVFFIAFLWLSPCWGDEFYAVSGPVQVDFAERISETLRPEEANKRAVLIERMPRRDRSAQTMTESERREKLQRDPHYFEKVAINIHYYGANDQISYTRTAYVHQKFFQDSETLTKVEDIIDQGMPDKLADTLLSPPFEDCDCDWFDHPSLTQSDSPEWQQLLEFYQQNFSSEETNGVELETLLQSPNSDLVAKMAHLAIRQDRPDIIKALVERGMSVDIKDENGKTLLFFAAEKNKHQVLDELLSMGANPDIPDGRGRFPLFHAINEKNMDTAKKLIPHASPDTIDSDGRNALHLAAHKNDLEIVTALHEQGTSLDTKDKDGKTPLFVAAEKNKHQSLEALLSAGANPDIPDERGRLPLFHAINEKNMGTAKKLIPHANLQATDSDGRNALHLAAHKNDPEIIKALAEKGARLDAKDKDGKTPLFTAAEKNKHQSLGALLSAEANPNLPDERGRLPLTHAIREGNLETARQLIPAANSNLPDSSGRNALHMAADYDRAELIPQLLRRNANPNAFRTEGTRHPETALMIAIRREKFGAFEALVTRSDVNAVQKSPQGHYTTKTALFLAAEKGHLQAVEKLLQHGADPGIPYRSGVFRKKNVSPAEVARKNGHHEIADRLERASSL